ncbi:hypothetical protein GCM10017620_27260 [Brevundimonas intermedia]|uniref:Uncharacterized protein n=1 Tax=Brevundimonas intermedia TaxID=74315 RepID=A0ABQ5TC78_9CAUL|nr:hypothetical protein [Brevundimonas intermedia]GLK49752.1 hypothetical protein GCM10017620_27260 [Brevundimonas intermedia]
MRNFTVTFSICLFVSFLTHSSRAQETSADTRRLSESRVDNSENGAWYLVDSSPNGSSFVTDRREDVGSVSFYVQVLSVPANPIIVGGKNVDLWIQDFQIICGQNAYIALGVRDYHEMVPYPFSLSPPVKQFANDGSYVAELMSIVCAGPIPSTRRFGSTEEAIHFVERSGG